MPFAICNNGGANKAAFNLDSQLKKIFANFQLLRGSRYARNQQQQFLSE
jgi:hypothetical protein